MKIITGISHCMFTVKVQSTSWYLFYYYVYRLIWPFNSMVKALRIDQGIPCSIVGFSMEFFFNRECCSLNACKDTGLAANTGKTKYMEIGRHRGVLANVHIKIGSFL